MTCHLASIRPVLGGAGNQRMSASKETDFAFLNVLPNFQLVRDEMRVEIK
jgi:pyruvate-formate lyase